MQAWTLPRTGIATWLRCEWALLATSAEVGPYACLAGAQLIGMQAARCVDWGVGGQHHLMREAASHGISCCLLLPAGALIAPQVVMTAAHVGFRAGQHGRPSSVGGPGLPLLAACRLSLLAAALLLAAEIFPSLPLPYSARSFTHPRSSRYVWEATTARAMRPVHMCKER